MLKALWTSLISAFVGRSKEEDYEAGRAYALRELNSAVPPTQETLDNLWAQSKSDGTFGGDGYFDRGVEDVLTEAGHKDPEDPCSFM